MNYQEKLKDPRWQKKRLEIMQRDNFSCQLCGNRHFTLHIHHKSYKKGFQPWEYEASNLITLCEICHEITEYWKDLKADILKVYMFTTEDDRVLDIDVVGVAQQKQLLISAYNYNLSSKKLTFRFMLNKDQVDSLYQELANAETTINHV
jgi:hypothetical protein